MKETLKLKISLTLGNNTKTKINKNNKRVSNYTLF
jgi:hypothetical protein